MKLISALMNGAVGEGALVDRERQLGEVGLAEDGGDERGEDVGHQRRHDGGERSADDDGDSELDHVAPEDELLELGDDALLLFGHAQTLPCRCASHRVSETTPAVARNSFETRSEARSTVRQRMRAWASVTCTGIVVERVRVPRAPAPPLDADHVTS